jgi:ribose transport system permease protein
VSAIAGTIEHLRARPRDVLLSWVRNNGWVLSLLAFLALLLVLTRMIVPTYGVAGIQGLAISVLPLALAAVAQAIVVISGGLDLSIGSMMALNSVVAARLMQGQSEEFAVLVVIGVLILGLTLGLINGALVVVTRVPDIVVTLAMLFVWAGVALLVLNTPGGGSATWLRALILGSVVGWVPPVVTDSVPIVGAILEWIPKAAIVLTIVVAVIWIPVRRSRLGLALYAVGSNRLAAYRSGVSIGRTKIAAYMLTGLFAALAGLSLTASTGIGTPVPGPYTLMSVAAVVLGGVSLAGGRGGVVGPIIAVVILALIRADMTFLRIDTNLATVLQGMILIGVVMAGSLIAMRRARA